MAELTPDNVQEKSTQVFLSLDTGVEVRVVDGHLAPDQVRVDDLLVLVMERSVLRFDFMQLICIHMKYSL